MQPVELGRSQIRLPELGPVHLRKIPEGNIFAAHNAVMHPVGQGIAIRAVHQEELRSKRCEIHGLGRAVQHQRQKCSLLSRVTSQSQNGCEMVFREVEPGRLAARRIRETNRHRMRLQRIAKYTIRGIRVAEVLPAFTVIGAALENTRERSASSWPARMNEAHIG